MICKAQTFLEVKIDQSGIESCFTKVVEEFHPDKNSLKVFPVPAKEIMKVEWTNSQLKGEVVIQLFNQLGQEVLNRETNIKGILKSEIDVSDLSNGI